MTFKQLVPIPFSKISIKKNWVSICNVVILGIKMEELNNVIKLYPANVYLFTVNNRNIIKRCERCSKLTIKIPERRQ